MEEGSKTLLDSAGALIDFGTSTATKLVTWATGNEYVSYFLVAAIAVMVIGVIFYAVRKIKGL